jgi:hypothetical protein
MMLYRLIRTLECIDRFFDQTIQYLENRTETLQRETLSAFLRSLRSYTKYGRIQT